MIIVLFHALYLLGKYMYENFHANKRKIAENSDALLNVTESVYRDGLFSESKDEQQAEKVKFFPPLYIQRYVAVQDVIAGARYQGKLRKVVEFGCAELSFVVYLKNTKGVEEILCVDVDRQVLENSQTRAAPLHADYLCVRTEPLTIHIYEGSVTHNDKKLENCDAVVCIELIEHLYPDTLHDFPINIFGYIRPQVAIVTTPNIEFNVLFPNLSGFRHADHKFEWTREQFEDWANNIVTRYPDYEVSFHGIGKGPPGTEHLGSCSQMAVFHRHSQLNDEPVKGVTGLFKSVLSQEFPYRIDNRSDEEKILDEAIHYIRLFSRRDSEMSEEVPLESLMRPLKKFYISIERVREILEEANWAVEDREDGLVVLVPQPSTFSSVGSDDFEDFLENDYHERRRSWDDLEPGAPSNHFFDSYMGIDSRGYEDENWDEPIWDEESQDVRQSDESVTDEDEVIETSALDASGTLDVNADSQWSIEDLGSRGSLEMLVLTPNDTLHSFNIENGLPAATGSMELEQMNVNDVGVSNNASFISELFSSENIATPNSVDALQSLSLKDISEMSLEDERSSEEIIRIQNENGSSTSSNLGVPSCGLGEHVSQVENYDMNHGQQTDLLSEKPNVLSCKFTVEENRTSTADRTGNVDKVSSAHDRMCIQISQRSCNKIEIAGEKVYESDSRFSVDDSVENTIQNLRSEKHTNVEDRVSMKKVQQNPQILSEPIEEGSQKHDIYNKNEEKHASSSRENCKFKKKPQKRTKTRKVEESDIETAVPQINLNTTHCSEEVSTSQDDASGCQNLTEECPNLAANENLESTSYTSLRSGSEVSVSTVTSTGSSAVGKWYSMEENPMYQRELIVLKGGNDAADKPDDETTSDSDVPTSDSHTDEEKQMAKRIHRSKMLSSSCKESKLNQQKSKSNDETIVEDRNAIETEKQWHERNETEQRDLRKNTEMVEIRSDNFTIDQMSEQYSQEKIKERENSRHLPNSDSDAVQDNQHSVNFISGAKNIEDRNLVQNSLVQNSPLKQGGAYSREMVLPALQQRIIGEEISKSNQETHKSMDVECSLGKKSVTSTFSTEDRVSVRQSLNSESVETAKISESLEGLEKNLMTIIYDTSKVSKTVTDICHRSSAKDNSSGAILETGKTFIENIADFPIFSKETKTKSSRPSLPLNKVETAEKKLFYSYGGGCTSNAQPTGISNGSFVMEDSLKSMLKSNLKQAAKDNCGYSSECSSNVSKDVSQPQKMLELTKTPVESVEAKPGSPEILDTPPNSWSPEIMDSGYPNSASIQDMTPECDLSSIANDRISDSESPSVAEAPRPGFFEIVEVENGDLANNNRDGEGNNVVAVEIDVLEDLQPLIDVLENDLENENDIYVLQNGFPLWLLRILEMANPIDIDGVAVHQHGYLPLPVQAGGDAPDANADDDEGFDSSSEEDSDIEDDEEPDDVTTISSEDTEIESAENLRRDWRAGGDP